MGFWSGVTSAVTAFKGFKDITEAVGGIFGDVKGQPGQGPVPSLVTQKPDFNFGSMSLKEGTGLMGHRGNIRLDKPTGEPGQEFIRLQKNYLASTTFDLFSMGSIPAGK